MTILYLPRASGGVSLPALSSLYKRLQVSRQCSLLISPDPCVRHLAEKGLQAEVQRVRQKFKPAVVVRDVLQDDPGCSRRVLRCAARKRVQEAEDSRRRDHLLSLGRQGQMLGSADADASSLWAGVLHTLPPETTKFALNAAVDMLPHNANLLLWRKKDTDICPLCGERQTLIHVLNCCPVALNQGRYNRRHDGVLQILVDAVRSCLSPSCCLTADLGGGYHYPFHLVSTDLKPDVVWWDDSDHSIVFLELTVAFETSFSAASLRKRDRYADLVASASSQGLTASLLTIEIGSRGVPSLPGFLRLKEFLTMPSRDYRKMLQNCMLKALEGSFDIWTSRNSL